jgi:hypothetical protein
LRRSSRTSSTSSTTRTPSARSRTRHRRRTARGPERGPPTSSSAARPRGLRAAASRPRRRLRSGVKIRTAIGKVLGS